VISEDSEYSDIQDSPDRSDNDSPDGSDDDSEYLDSEDSPDRDSPAESVVSVEEFFTPVNSEEEDEDEEPVPVVTKTDKELFGNLTELTSELNLNEPLFPGSKVNTLEMLSNISILGKKLNLSKECMSDFLSMMELVAPVNSTLAQNLHSTFQEKIVQISHKSDTENIRLICSNCKTDHQDKNSKLCPNCNTNNKSKLVLNDLKELLTSLLETRGLAQILESQVDCFSAKPPPSGAQIVYKDLPSSAKPSDSIYDLQLIHNSKSFQPPEYEKDMLVWSHLFAIRNLPPLMRSKFVLAGAVISAKKDTFLELSRFYFKEIIKPLLEQGLKWRHPVSNLEITSKISIIVTTTGDQQVERTLNLLESTHACKICNIEASTFKLRGDYGPKLKKGDTVRGYMHAAGPFTLRTHFPKSDPGIAAGSKDTKHFVGILNPPALLLSTDCPIITNTSPDYFGSSVMGVVKKWTVNIFSSTKKNKNEDFLSQYGSIMEDQMSNFSTPDFSRKPHIDSTVDIEYVWNHDDFRNWLLYFSLPCLSGRIPKKQLEQHGLLVESINLLLKSEVTETDRKRAEVLLAEYSKTQSQSPHLRSMNLHKHLHFAESVKHLGPLWAHSSYTFHKANDTIESTVTETSRPDKPNRLNRAPQLVYAIEALNESLSLKLLQQVNKMRDGMEDFLLTNPIDPATDIKNKAVTDKIGSEAALAMTTFGHCKVGDVSYFSSLMFAKERGVRSLSYFVAYEEPQDKVLKYALVTAFFLVGGKKYFTGRSVLLKEAAFKTSLGCDVSHIRKYSTLKEYVCEEVACLRKPLYHLVDLLAEPPNMFEIKEDF
jgi:hypothetical protein